MQKPFVGHAKHISVVADAFGATGINSPVTLKILDDVLLAKQLTCSYQSYPEGADQRLSFVLQL